MLNRRDEEFKPTEELEEPFTELPNGYVDTWSMLIDDDPAEKILKEIKAAKNIGDIRKAHGHANMEKLLSPKKKDAIKIYNALIEGAARFGNCPRASAYYNEAKGKGIVDPAMDATMHNIRDDYFTPKSSSAQTLQALGAQGIALQRLQETWRIQYLHKANKENKKPANATPSPSFSDNYNLLQRQEREKITRAVYQPRGRNGR